MKKGFTLIELLAVIIVLAIIALIATPMVLDIVEDSRKSANRTSVYMIINGASNYYADSMLDDSKKLEMDGKTNVYDKIIMSGEKPENGTLYINKQGQVSIAVVYGDTCYKKDFTDTKLNESDDIDNCVLESTPEITYKCKRATTLHTETCSQTSTSEYCSGAGYTIDGSKGTTTITYGSLGTSGTLTSGDAFDCDVNGDGVYDAEEERFYYVSDLYNTTNKSFDSNYAVLIYYNNTTKGIADNTSSSSIAYYETAAENWHGPQTAITNLPTNTQWSNVSLSKTSRAILTETGNNLTTGGTLPTEFSYAGYSARLLTVQEVNSACGITIGTFTNGEIDTCNYMMENTRYSSSSFVKNGFWLETPYGSIDYQVWSSVGQTRRISSFNTDYIDNSGVRPAIEVLKTDIEY